MQIVITLMIKILCYEKIFNSADGHLIVGTISM